MTSKLHWLGSYDHHLYDLVYYIQDSREITSIYIYHCLTAVGQAGNRPVQSGGKEGRTLGL